MCVCGVPLGVAPWHTKEKNDVSSRSLCCSCQWPETRECPKHLFAKINPPITAKIVVRSLERAWFNYPSEDLRIVLIVDQIKLFSFEPLFDRDTSYWNSFSRDTCYMTERRKCSMMELEARFFCVVPRGGREWIYFGRGTFRVNTAGRKSERPT